MRMSACLQVAGGICCGVQGRDGVVGCPNVGSGRTEAMYRFHVLDGGELVR